MNSRELRLKRERDEAKDGLLAALEEAEQLRADLAKMDKRLAHYMNVNSDLWLQLSKLPGGLEPARRIKAATQ